MSKDKQTYLLIGILCGVLIILVAVIWILGAGGPTQPSAADLPEMVPASASPAQTAETRSGTPTQQPAATPKPEMLPEMASLYAENPDVIAWITIEGTNVDYPVMFVPDDEERYLYRNFEGNYDIQGLPFLDKDCAMDPESGNLIIYGHNITTGTMFHDLLYYEDEAYWQEHRTLTFRTLYEERTYEIIGAFRDRVYYRSEDVFKFYQFIDTTDPAAFQEAISYYEARTPYETDINAQCGDRLLTLVTCAYHHEHGRYVVIAREVSGTA